MEILVIVSLALCAVAYLVWQVHKKMTPPPEPKTEVQVLIERANKLLAERGHVLNDSVKAKADADRPYGLINPATGGRMYGGTDIYGCEYGKIMPSNED